VLAATPAATEGRARSAIPPLTTSAASVEAELAGLPQQGLVLGASTAPVTVVEYADLICLPCARAATTLLEPLISGPVAQGMVRLEFEPIVESQRSSEFTYGADSAGLQEAGWDFLLLAYARTTPRSDGSVNPPAALADALGLNYRHWHKNLFRPMWASQAQHAAAIAAVGGFATYPVFTVRGPAPPGTRPQITILRPPVTLPALSAAISSAQAAAP
jgi:hypothetical protein